MKKERKGTGRSKMRGIQPREGEEERRYSVIGRSKEGIHKNKWEKTE